MSVSNLRRPVQFTAPGGWSVKVVSYLMSGPDGRPVVCQFYQVKLWAVLIKETNDVDYVRRAMGPDAYAELVEVTTP